MKPYEAVCGHKKYNDENTTFWKKVATVLVPDYVAEAMEAKGDKLVIIPNDSPGVSWVVSFKKFEESNERASSKY